MEESASPLGEVARTLENIRAITDDTFAYMDVDEFLDTLLKRVQQILEIDTAVVLLVDRQGQFLVATAAKGIEEEVNQGVQVPLGQGFAGRVATERRPVYIDDVPGSTVFNQPLVRRGVRSLLGVPLIAGGKLLGVLHVGTHTKRRFTADETEFLQLAAARAALAVQSLLSRAERAGAIELQRSLVPSALPAIPGVEMAARYRPGTESVGGDWYDVFRLPGGEIGIVMGDVAGHGLPAAVVMGRMRSALRAYALETTDPAEVLRRLDRKIHHFEPEATATVVYAVCDPTLDQARLSSAGHPSPVLAVPGGAAQSLTMRPDLLIGTGEDTPRSTATVALPEGALLCFFTDGLVERRDSSIDSGIDRLRAAVRYGPPETACAAVMAAFIGRKPPEDDVALLLIRRAPQ